MASQTITLNKVQTQLLIQELMHLEELKKTLLRIIPESYLPKGSDLWWEKSDLEAMEDVKAGRYTTIKNHKELDRFLDKLK